MPSKSKIDIVSWSAPPGKEVYLCGVGVRTPLGFDAAATAAAVRGAISAVGEHPFFIDKAGKPINMAWDAGLAVELAAGLDISHRIKTMLLAAMNEALGNAMLSWKDISIPCWIGFPESRPGLLPDVVRTILSSVLTEFGIAQNQVYLLQKGHCSGLMAMQNAATQISSGEMDICLVAGVDSYHSRMTLDWLDATGVLLSSKNRNGFIPGEAASACILASDAAVKRYQLPVLASITAAATGVEPHPIRGEEVCIGEGLSAVLKDIIVSLRSRQQAITATYCDLNGERYRNEEYVYTILRTQEGFIDANDYQCPAECWGDVGAASGLLFASLAVASKQRGYANGPIPVLWAGSESGYRSAVLLNLEESA